MLLVAVAVVCGCCCCCLLLLVAVVVAVVAVVVAVVAVVAGFMPGYAGKQDKYLTSRAGREQFYAVPVKDLYPIKDIESFPNA